MSDDRSFFGTNTSQRDFPKMTGHFSVQIHPSTIFLFFTTHRALVFEEFGSPRAATALLLTVESVLASTVVVFPWVRNLSEPPPHLLAHLERKFCLQTRSKEPLDRIKGASRGCARALLG